MDKKELFQLYEKLYFHEIDAREKLNSRLQTPLTLIVSLIGALAFLVQNYAHQTSVLAALFIIFSGFAALTLATAMYFFVKSWMGTEYFFLPAAVESEAYRQQLIRHFAPYETDGELSSAAFTNYIMDYYIKYSSKNTDANDSRSLRIHKTNICIVVAAAFSFAAFLVFYFGDFDKANKRKPTEITVVQPVVIKGEVMSVTKPPPPPAPPPPRQIREGVEIVKRPQPSNQGSNVHDNK
ncbi:hypothetical protein GJ699_00490 [Duganella sp. FT80W]|uniref:Uncharacterized protein n=1 Tax=Duganella guangzhouensis TaxID=2666084 RepID=A0A6I2KSX3_9BURK|nr:hypothetical protein [Duganella guangzhouensis]MRW88462.1 hypothetical protein [Duganella guangzhouensis]